MQTIDALAHQLSSYLEPAQINLVRRAYLYAEQAHDGQKRRSGDPYITHPLAVAVILSGIHMDHQSLMAAMLHDVIEDTRLTREDLAELFGAGVAVFGRNLTDEEARVSTSVLKDELPLPGRNVRAGIRLTF